jgi:hypothetical protein
MLHHIRHLLQLRLDYWLEKIEHGIDLNDSVFHGRSIPVHLRFVAEKESFFLRYYTFCTTTKIDINQSL